MELRDTKQTVWPHQWNHSKLHPFLTSATVLSVVAMTPALNYNLRLVTPQTCNRLYWIRGTDSKISSRGQLTYRILLNMLQSLLVAVSAHNALMMDKQQTPLKLNVKVKVGPLLKRRIYCNSILRGRPR